MAPRGQYRQHVAAELAAIEARRQKLGATVDVLAERAGIDRRTLQRMRRSGLGFKRHVAALKLALRTMEAEARRRAAYGPGAMFGKGEADEG